MTVNIDAAVSKDLPSSGGETTVEVTLNPVSKAKPTTRHVALLIDTSFSMNGEKIENAKIGAKQAIQKLDAEDYVSVVGFDSSVETVVPMTRWGDVDHADVMADIEAIDATNGTDIYKGLEAVREQLVADAPENPRAVKRIILLSDGQDRYDADTYRDLAAEYDDDGLSIIAAGIGHAYDEAVILALANASGGEPVDLSEEAISEFLEETVGNTENVLASKPVIEIEPEQGFILQNETAYFEAPTTKERIIDTDASPNTLALPELELGTTQRFTLRALGQPKSAGLTHDLATLCVRDATGSELAETTVRVDYTADGGLTRADIEKNRAAAKVRVDIQDPDVAKARVEDGIERLRNEGWNDTASDLERDLTRANEDGGLIRVSKAESNSD
jgi:uncharacterized protein YegL